MRRKLKLSMLDDYIAIYNIIYVCKYYCLSHEHKHIENEIKQLESSAKSLQERYENTFQKAGIADTSFLILKNELLQAISYSVMPRANFLPEKIEYLNNKLKRLEVSHNENYLKIKFRKHK